MQKLIAVLAFMLLFGSISFGQTADDAYHQTLEKMFEVSGSEETYKAAITQVMGMFREQYPEVNAKEWDELEAEFMKRSINELVVLLVPVYQKYLTQEDLEAIIEFYKTPVGKKFALHNPAIMQESMQIGQQWGMQIGQELQQRLQKEGN